MKHAIAILAAVFSITATAAPVPQATHLWTTNKINEIVGTNTAAKIASATSATLTAAKDYTDYAVAAAGGVTPLVVTNIAGAVVSNVVPSWARSETPPITQETDPTVPAWAKAENPPSAYTDDDAWIVATNAIDTVASESITTAINTAMEDAFGTDWKTALGYGAGGFAGMIAAIFAALTMLKTGKLNKSDVVSPDGSDGFNNGKAADQGWVENYKTDCALTTTEIVDYYELKDSGGNYIRAHEGSGGIWSATYKTYSEAAVSTICNGDYPVAVYYGAGETASGALVVTFDKTNGWVQRSPYFNALMDGAVVDLDHNVISKTVTSLDKTTAKKAASLTDTALDFDETKTYAVGAFVKHGTDYYRCKTAITTAVAWDATKWERILTTGDVGGLVKLTPVFTDWSVSTTGDLVGRTITFEWTRRSQGAGYVECWGYRISAGSLNYTDYTDKNATALEVITASGTISASRTIDHYTMGSGTEELLAGTKSSLFSSDGFNSAVDARIEAKGSGIKMDDGGPYVEI